MELVDIVDGNDVVIGRVARKEAHERGLWHRGTHVPVFDREGRVLLHVRGEDDYHGKYDLSVSEHVTGGEDYHRAAVRGLEEELGIRADR